MSEYIVELDSKHSIALKLAFLEEMRGGDFIRGEIVRCRDCEYFDTRKCKSQWPFCLDAFCWWGEPKEGVE